MGMGFLSKMMFRKYSKIDIGEFQNSMNILKISESENHFKQVNYIVYELYLK